MRGARLAPDAYTGKRAATRDRLMDACAELIVRTGLPTVSMTAIAEEAGITRQTVYRYFANGDEVVQATLLRAGAEVQEAQRLTLSKPGEVGELLIDAVLVSLRQVEGSPLLRQVGGMPELAHSMLDKALTPGFLRPGVEALDGVASRVGWTVEESREAYEILSRAVLSLLLVRPQKAMPEATLRDILRRRLLPALGVRS